MSVVASAQTAPSLLPSTVKLIAGGASAPTAAGGSCPVSGNIATDAYGDGCLATEIQLGNVAAGNAKPGARAAVMDIQGNVFFSDYNNNLIRRIDAATGIVTAVAGGASTAPTVGTACGTGIAVDAKGDGCLSTAVVLKGPLALAFASNGDLYFSETAYYDVRKIAATGGLIPSTGGIITNVAGYTGGATYGYVVSNSTTTVIAASQSYIDEPAAIAFDNKGDLYIAERYKNAVLVVNTNATGSNTVNGVTVAAGTIWRVAGAYTGPTDCANGTSGTYGCSYGKYTEGATATATFLDNPYGVAADTNGNVYFSNEYYNQLPVVSSTGILTTYAGTGTGKLQANTVRGAANATAIGSPFGVGVDAQNNVYFNDATAGIIWRVDTGSQLMYAVAGGATTVCAAATDTLGDGCTGLNAKFYAVSSGSYSSTTLPAPGLYGLNVDGYSDVLVGDTENNNVRGVMSGTYFGAIGLTSTTNKVVIHFAKGDSPASSGAYTLVTGSSVFTLGTATCVTNSDTTQDCTLSIVAKPTAVGFASGSFKVVSSLGGTATFPLGVTAITSKVTTTVITSNLVSCSSTVNYPTSTSVTLTATVSAYVTPAGTVQFYNNGVPIGSAITVSSAGVATLTQTFPAGTNVITAKYSGDANTNPSTAAAYNFTTATGTFGLSAVNAGQQSTVTAGQTALYSFSVQNSAYVGTLSFSCSGLPSGAACIFNPSTYTLGACDSNETIALNITTSARPTTLSGLTGRWGLAAAAALVAFGIGLRRRKMAGFGVMALAFAALLGAASITGCSSTISDKSIQTPAGTYSVTVTIAGTPTASAASGSSQTFTLPLTVK